MAPTFSLGPGEEGWFHLYTSTFSGTKWTTVRGRLHGHFNACNTWQLHARVPPGPLEVCVEFTDTSTGIKLGSRKLETDQVSTWSKDEWDESFEPIQLHFHLPLEPVERVYEIYLYRKDPNQLTVGRQYVLTNGQQSPLGVIIPPISSEYHPTYLDGEPVPVEELVQGWLWSDPTVWCWLDAIEEIAPEEEKRTIAEIEQETADSAPRQPCWFSRPPLPHWIRNWGEADDRWS